MARILFLLLVLLSPFLLAEPPTFTVCWWNIENFGVTDRYIGGHHVFAAMKPESEQRAVAAILQKLDPDILGVTEVLQDPEDRYLKILRGLLKSHGLDYPYFTTAKGQDPRIQMVLFSRFPLEASHFTEDTYPVTVVSGTGETMDTIYRVNRGFLNVTIHVTPQFDLQVLTAHLKSKLPERTVASDSPGEPGEAYVRRHEASLLKGHIDHFLENHPQACLLVIGDLNDTIGSRPLATILGARNGSPSVRAIELKDYLGDQWTEFYQAEGIYSRIDYMLANDRLGQLIVPGKSYLYRWREGDPRELDHYEASDHRPLLVTIRVPES